MRIYNAELFYPMLANVSLDSRGDAAKYAAPESPPSSEDNLPTNILNCLKDQNHRNPVKKSGNHFRNLTELHLCSVSSVLPSCS